MRVIFSIILTLCIVATVFVVGMNEDNDDNTITQLYAGSVREEAYSAKGRVKSCPEIMMETVYTVPLNENDERKQKVRPTLYAYDKYGTEVVHHGYRTPQSTYSYKVDEDGNLSEVTWHDFAQGPESEYSKVTLEYYSESNAVEITRWHGPVLSSPMDTSMLRYELDETGRVVERTETRGSGNSDEGNTYVYQRDINGNVTHELMYSGDKLRWDEWHISDSNGNELMAGMDNMSGFGPSVLSVYENKAFDECGNWTCRVVDSKGFVASGETIHDESHMEYRSLLYYPD